METIFPNLMAENEKHNAQSNIFLKYGSQLRSFIRRRVGIIEDAEDIMQDVWHQFSRLTSLDELENTGAWLFSVARNRITDFYRKQKTDNLEDYTYEDEEGFAEIRDILLSDESADPEFGLFRDLFWNELMKALNELPENQRSVFVQNEMEDKTLQEIADASGENLKTIISRKGYAMKHIRKKLQPLYNEINQY